jgi:exodeoxyribonuclease V alpha subunit
MDTIFGYIESVVFSSEETGFTVARLKEPKKAELTTLVGAMPSLQPGESIRCEGSWKNHPQHGRQFEVTRCEFEAPSDLLGIQKYLESGMIKGIGKVYAERIVKQFGLDTLQVIDATPERLFEVSGLGKKRVETIISCWGQQRAIRGVMIFLRSHGISPAYAQKIYKTYGDQSIEKVSSNPYSLAKEIHGVGFKTADRIAKNLGIPSDSPVRIDAGIEHLLWELTNEGHVCYPEKEYIPQAKELLEATDGQIEERLEALIQGGHIMREDPFIWIKPLYLSEVGIARELARLCQTPSPLRSIDPNKAISWVQEKLQLQLAIQQKEAVGAGTSSKVLIITGGPGTGKSTITNAILTISDKLTTKIMLAAPTGRAAKRMTEITKKKAFTIHALLEMDFKAGGFKHKRDNPLDCDLIIIDEVSMVDTLLMHHLLKAIPSHARLILIGDIDQLPSVGPGNVLKDMIQSGCLPVYGLTQIFRQAAGSQIVTNAHFINKGVMPSLRARPQDDFFFISADSPETICNTICDLVLHRLPRKYRFHRFDDIQVLSPMKRGVIGCENLNVVLQRVLNPHPSPLTRMGRSFHPGDKVMQLRNNYQKHVYNGDIGTVHTIDEQEEIIKVRFDERVVSYDFSEIDELVLAYAVSIHKYQGSECPCVIIPIHMSHFKLLFRNLLYTGITRGKKLVILVGSKKALAMAIQNDEVLVRHTGLRNAVTRFF